MIAKDSALRLLILWRKRLSILIVLKMNDMERKIGEIFEYNGEWYQAVDNTNSIMCSGCAFVNEYNECEVDISVVGHCGCKDGNPLIFKKLEKVGEPYNIGTHIYQRYKVFMKPYIFNDSYFAVNPAIDDEFINIEVKQTKEDIEENKTPLPKEENSLTKAVSAYINGKISDKELIKSVKEMPDEYPYDKSNLKPFSLEAAKQGKPVCTRDGRKARIICFDAKRKDEKSIIALVPSKDYPGFEDLIAYPNNGNYYGGHENDGDLMMLPEKKEGWVNVYDADTTFYFVEGRVYDTKEEAIKHIIPDHEIYTTTVKIEWEE